MVFRSAGAPLGGLLADYVNWRFAFVFQAPLCLIAMLSVYFALKLPRKEVENWGTKFRRIDFLGSAILILAVFALLLGLDRGSNDSWTNPVALVPLCLFAPLAFLFVFIEFKVAIEPIAPRHIVLERSLIACYLCNFFAFAAWMAIIFYLPLFYQAYFQYSASSAGLGLLPAILASVAGSLSGGLVMQRSGRYYWLTAVAYTTSALAVIPIVLGTGLLATSVYGISIGLVFSGFGNGIGITTTLIGLIANAAPEDLAIVTACSYLFRSSGSAIGLSLASTVVQQSLRNQLGNKLKSGGEAENIVRNVRQSLRNINDLSPGLQAIVRECYATAIQHGFWYSMCLAACAAVVSCKFGLLGAQGRLTGIQGSFVRKV